MPVMVVTVLHVLKQRAIDKTELKQSGQPMKSGAHPTLVCQILETKMPQEIVQTDTFELKQQVSMHGKHMK